MSEQSQNLDEAGAGAGRPGVSEADVENAMAVHSVPDETRLHGDPDETAQVMGGDGVTRPVDEPADGADDDDGVVPAADR